MSKLMCFIVTICVVLGLSVAVLAAPTVEVSYEEEAIVVSGTTTPGDEVTVLVLPANLDLEGDIVDTDIMYIDQMTSDATSGAYGFTFLMRDGAQSGDYDVWVGGTDVISPTSGTIEYTVGDDDPPTYVLGDVDGNGAINVSDAIYVMRAIAGTYELDARAALAANVDGNKTVDDEEIINVSDAIYIMRHIAGTLPIFPADPSYE